jgi:hypothetical protein
MDIKEQYYLQRRFTKDDAIVSRVVLGECILVPIRRKSGDVASIYTLNEVGSRIWELIDGNLRVDEISSVILEEFDVMPEDSRKDVVQFLVQLETLGAVREI